MSTRNLLQILNLVNQSKDFTKAVRHTRFNGTILPIDTRGNIITRTQGFTNTQGFTGGYWKIGLELTRKSEDGIFVLTGWTVEDSRHVISFSAKLTLDCQVIAGSVNCFALGYMSIDQDYIDELLSEFSSDNEESKIVWDTIEN